MKPEKHKTMLTKTKKEILSLIKWRFFIPFISLIFSKRFYTLSSDINQGKINNKKLLEVLYQKHNQKLSFLMNHPCTGRYRYVPLLLADSTVLSGITKKNVNTSDFVCLWGILFDHKRYAILKNAKKFHKPILLLEHGFLCSVGHHATASGISLIADDLGIYYDSTRSNRLENMLNSDIQLSENEITRAQNAIKKIINNKLTKYNNCAPATTELPGKNAKKVLVIDQKRGDASIVFGGATEKTFQDMLSSAITENPDADIIVKTHPEKNWENRGYFDYVKPSKNIFLLETTTNPICLIQSIDKVYCVSSQMGFEALMCGKEVHCFGIPFYSGWGITQDRQKCSRRTQQRTLEEIFYCAYIKYTKYCNPDNHSLCEIEDAMDYLICKRTKTFNTNLS